MVLHGHRGYQYQMCLNTLRKVVMGLSSHKFQVRFLFFIPTLTTISLLIHLDIAQAWYTLCPSHTDIIRSHLWVNYSHIIIIPIIGIFIQKKTTFFQSGQKAYRVITGDSSSPYRHPVSDHRVGSKSHYSTVVGYSIVILLKLINQGQPSGWHLNSFVIILNTHILLEGLEDRTCVGNTLMGKLNFITFTEGISSNGMLMIIQTLHEPNQFNPLTIGEIWNRPLCHNVIFRTHVTSLSMDNIEEKYMDSK